jgi:hypothetical protein
VLAAVGLLDIWLLVRFFRNPALEAPLQVEPSPGGTPMR